MLPPFPHPCLPSHLSCPIYCSALTPQVGLTEAVYASDAKLAQIERKLILQKRKNEIARRNMKHIPGVIWAKVGMVEC